MRGSTAAAAQALGYVGPLCCNQPGACDKIDLVNVSCAVGSHDWSLYEGSADVLARLGWYTFLQP